MRRCLCLWVALLLLSGCGGTQSDVDWGSFTADKTYSFDQEVYAVQSTQERDGAACAVVSICSARDDEVLCVLTPARARDFWGVCWETGSYNLWVQSGDVGVICYAYENGEWQADPSAVRPKDIVSKYD